MPQYIGSITPLGASDVFTSQWVVASPEFDLLTGTIFSDQSGSLAINQGGDGVHDDWTDTVAVTANTKTQFSIEIVSNYVQLIYTNGGVAQTVFRLYPRWRFNSTI